MSDIKQNQNSSEKDLMLELVKQQTRNAKSQKRTELAVIMICLIIGLSCAILLPRAIQTLNNVNNTLHSIDQAVETVNNDLIKLEGTIDSMNTLIEDNSEYLNDSMKSISEIDFEKLGRSIDDLYDIIAPLSNLFKR